jgi:hypothetical protein
VVAVSTLPALSLTRRRSAPPASRCTNTGRAVLPLASSSMAALPPDQALA